MTEGVRVLGATFRWQHHRVLGDDGLTARAREDAKHGLGCSPKQRP
jgi:hypothetical protein